MNSTPRGACTQVFARAITGDLPADIFVAEDTGETIPVRHKRIAAEGWHTDGAYDQEPFKATQLYALAVPSTAGDTRFASMYD